MSISNASRSSFFSMDYSQISWMFSDFSFEESESVLFNFKWGLGCVHSVDVAYRLERQTLESRFRFKSKILAAALHLSQELWHHSQDPQSGMSRFLSNPVWLSSFGLAEHSSNTACGIRPRCEGDWNFDATSPYVRWFSFQRSTQVRRFRVKTMIQNIDTYHKFGEN